MNGVQPLAHLLQRSIQTYQSCPMSTPAMTVLERIAASVLVLLAFMPILAVAAGRLAA